MTLSDIKKPESVIKAIEEFERIGKRAFFEKYSTWHAKQYVIVYNGEEYDSKAIIAAAHGYEFGAPLDPRTFSGGKDTVVPKLEELGFKVRGYKPGEREIVSTRAIEAGVLEPGSVWTNDQIHKHFKCSKQGGMRRSHATNSLVLICNHVSSIYDDRWHDDVLYYTGQGTAGDQVLEGNQNGTLAESGRSGIEVHLFEVFREKEYTYRGRVELHSEPYQASQLDGKGQSRQVWVFPLKLLGDPTPIDEEVIRASQRDREQRARKLDREEIARRAIEAGGRPVGRRQSVVTSYQRDENVTLHAKLRANGICELCREPAPFTSKDGTPYLETHHIEWLARGGADSIENTVALCPNCHRRMHALDLESDKMKLRQIAEPQSEFPIRTRVTS